MALQDIARSIVNRTGEFGGNVQELAKNILDKQRQRQEFFNQNPEAQKAVNRMKPPMQRAVEFIGKTYLYNPEEKKLFPSSPVHTIQDMRNIQQQRQSGELSEQEARKQLSDKALNMAMVVGELSPSPKAVNNQAARALKMLEEQAKQYDSFDDFVKSQGEPVYHGGSNIKNYEKELKILSPEEKLKYPSRGGGYIGFSTSKNPNVARNYSLASGTDEIAEFRLKPNAKILKVDTGGDGIDEYFTGKQLEELKKQGYDAVEDISKGIEDEVRILSEKAVYTKDQLKNIWNKANQPKPLDYIRSGDQYGKKEIGITQVDDMVARERFDLSKLKKISSGGSDRDVYDLGDGKVLKVSKSARGLAQNRIEGEPYAPVPKSFESGKNYVVVEKANPPNEQTKKLVKELKKLDVYQLNDERAPNHYEEVQKAMDILNKYDVDGDSLANYNVMWNDLLSIRNWGTDADGLPIHVDAGTFSQGILDDFKGVKNLNDPEFRDVYYQSKEAKKKFGDLDKNTMYGLLAPILGITALKRLQKEDIK